MVVPWWALNGYDLIKFSQFLWGRGYSQIYLTVKEAEVQKELNVLPNTNPLGPRLLQVAQLGKSRSQQSVYTWPFLLFAYTLVIYTEHNVD